MSDTSFTTEPSRAGADAAQNPMLSALLGAMGSGGGFDPAALLMSQLGNQAASDPKMAALSWLLSQRRPAPEIDGEAEETGEARAEAARARAAARAERARRIRELRALVKRTWVELEALRERNDTLAAALGACHLCFGTDPLCSACAGRGRPGSRPPEPAAYREYVLPALRRVRAITEALARQGAGVSPAQCAGAVLRSLAPQAAGHDEVPDRRVAAPAASEERRARV